MKLQKYNSCSRAARHLEPADILLKNAKIVNVFTDRVEEGNVAIKEGMIVGIGDYDADQVIDLNGAYLTSGFIDAHLHLESTLVNPQVLISRAAMHGTTTFIVDPHEAANVSGPEGIRYILDQTEDSPAHVYVMMPSCVPATPIDDNGVIMDAQTIKPFLSHRRVLGLGEVMDYISVIQGDPAMNEKLELFDGKVKDGHSPGLTYEDLSSYVIAGITTDHEATSFEYVMKERALGMTVHIREGSAARNLENIVKGIVENNINTEGFCFCTDDKHIEDITREGHIDHNVRKAVSMGISPIAAVKMATIQPARCYGLRRTGAVTPGFDADLVVWDSLKDFNAQMVFYKGTVIYDAAPSDDKRKAQTTRWLSIRPKPCPPELKDTVHLAPIDPASLVLRSSGGDFPAIHMIPGQIVTAKEMITLPVAPGSDIFAPDGTVNKIAAFERHHATGRIGVGAVTGFPIRGGAIASSVSHDSHNFIVIGDNDADILAAVAELERTKGGYTIVCGGVVYDTLELPVMGLISDRSLSYVNKKMRRLNTKARQMGVPKGMDPFITLSFMALPVIPEIRCTPRGVYDVSEGRLLPGTAAK